MESQTKTQTIKFKQVVVGAEEASGSSGWSVNLYRKCFDAAVVNACVTTPPIT